MSAGKKLVCAILYFDKSGKLTVIDSRDYN